MNAGNPKAMVGGSGCKMMVNSRKNNGTVVSVGKECRQTLFNAQCRQTLFNAQYV